MTSTNTVQCGVRTIRRACECGRTDLYNAHSADDDGTYHGVRKGTWCDEHATSDWTYVDRAGREHICTSTPSVPVITDAPPASNGHAGSFGGIATKTNVADVAAELNAGIMGALSKLSATIDEPSVRRIIAESNEQFRADLLQAAQEVVAEHVAKISLPTEVKVTRPDGEVKVIKGAHSRLPMIITLASIRKHVMMVGPMGTGKSTIARHAADSLGLPFYFIAVGPQTSKSDILGYMTADGTYVPSLFRKAYEHGGVFLFDELDAAHPGVLTVINSALANGHMAFPDGMIARHSDTVIMAAANTYGRGPDRMYVGRQAIDAATLDRFIVVEILVDEALESAICHATGLNTTVADKVIGYVRALRKSAESNRMAVGFSPRASEGMCALLNAGISADDAIAGCIRKGISDQDWTKVSGSIVTPRF